MHDQDSIINLCRPLFKQTEITYFSHTRIDKNLKFHGLSSDPNFSDYYLNKKFYNFDIHLLNLDNKINYIHCDMVDRTDEIITLHDAFAKFGYGHTFTIIESHDTYRDYYHFAADIENKSINNKYYQYTEILMRHILFFKEQLVKSKIQTTSIKHAT